MANVSRLRTVFILRTVVFLLAVGATIKLLTGSSKLVSQNIESRGFWEEKKSGQFFGQSGALQGWIWDSELSLVQVKKEEETKLEQAPVVEMSQKIALPPDPKAVIEKDYGPLGMKLVHLDLKGAPPRIAYLKKLIMYVARLGADGLLIEYEDMFPFTGDLEILRNANAYTIAEIEEIQILAAKQQLKIIPLVQTFGHLEFVLKHKQYWPLRESERYPNSINPHLSGSLNLVHKLLQQILLKHPAAECVHIGCDEVYQLSESAESKAWLARNGSTLGGMFLDHVRTVVQQLRDLRPGVRALIWDDMLRTIDEATLRDSGVAELVEPVVWAYSPNLNVKVNVMHIKKYSTCGIQAVWFASAFKVCKGAEGPSVIAPVVRHRVDNHLHWLEVSQEISTLSIRLRGIVLTGWQRYNHFAVLCELIPVGLPSLAICLQVLNHGGLKTEALNTATELLGFSKITDNPSIVWAGEGSFPGCEIHNEVLYINGSLRDSVTAILDSDYVRAWFSKYNRKHKFANPMFMEYFEPKARQVLRDWEEHMESLQSKMLELFFPDAVEEWFEVHVNPNLDRLRHLLQDYDEIIALKGQPKA
uniref:hexosaminidase D isoform X2 n=1 Tax=Myxine glutinosa TaxID=7769 RepID=UPI00358E1FF6